MLGIEIIFGLLSMIFFSIGLTLFGYRNDLETLATLFPLMRKQREARLQPLFPGKSEVVAIALVFLILGFGAFIIMFRL